MNKLFSRLAFSGLAALWISACVLGFWVLLKYQYDPGKPASALERWPAASSLSLARGRNTLVLFAHPRCPCSRASIDSLAWIMARSQGKTAAYALFFKPPQFPGGWEKTDLWEKASAIPGVAAIRDDSGAEAVRFGAETSGQVLLYDPQGELIFRGGITGSRGHFGDNAGRHTLLASIDQGKAASVVSAESRVFGCSLLSAKAQREDEGNTGKLSRWMRTIARL